MAATTNSRKPRQRREPAGTRSRAAWLAWCLCVATLLLGAAVLVLILLGWSAELPDRWTSWQEQALAVVGFIGAPVLGGLIAARRPANIYGWLWLGLGAAQALMLFAQAYATYALVVEPGSLPAPRTVAAVLGQGWIASILIFPFLLLLFPDGRLPSRRWRVLAWVIVLVGTPLLALGALAPGEGMVPVENPIGIRGPVGEVIGAVFDPAILILFAAIVLSALSLVFRYRRASGIQRQQIKWFAYAAALNGSLVAIDVFGLSDRLLRYEFGYWVWVLLGDVGITTLYVAVGIAILKYRLYEIDLLINRTLVYGSLTATLVLVYVGSVVLLQGAFRALTGQETQLATVAATLAIAALFNPLRRRIQDFIDRRFYRRKYDAAKTLEAFSARLRDETDLETLSEDLMGAVRVSLQPSHLTLWVRPDSSA
jgi:hypothetical protein